MTAEIFEEIVASLRSDKSRRTQEKRSLPRVGLRSSVQIYPSPTSGNVATAITVWVRDVSADGLGMVSPQPIAADALFVAEFERPGRQQLRVQYRVAHCKQLSGGLHSIGAKLVKVLPDRAEPMFAGFKPRAKSA